MFFLLFSLIDINRASIEEIAKLPLKKEDAVKIYLYIKTHGGINSIYQLLQVEGITPEKFLKIKDSIIVLPSKRKRRDLWYIRDTEKKLASEESPSYLFVENWRKGIIFPLNINKADIDELISFDGVSLVDAYSIKRYIKGHERIRSFGEMRRNVEGLSGYGYRNLKPYVVFKDYAYPGYHGDFKINTRTGEDTSFSYLKATILFGKNYTLGFSSSGLEDLRGFIGVENKGILYRLYVGNYRAVWAQGLVLSTVPETRPRYHRVIEGISGDALYTSSYTLQGTGGVLKLSDTKLFFVLSSVKRNGIENPDGSINSYFPSYKIYSQFNKNFKENAFGMRLKYSPEKVMPFSVGFSGLFLSYDKELKPLAETLDREGDGYTLDDLNYLFLPSGRTFGFLGIDGRGVVGGNTEFSAELAFSKEKAYAFISKIRYQKNERYILFITRDYSLKYSNPFLRGFYEQVRLDDTPIEYEYRVKDPRYTELSYLPMPKAERGVYVETRYQFHRNFILTKGYLDIWENRALGKMNTRLQIPVEYRIFYPLRVRLTQKLQKKWRLSRGVFTKTNLDEKTVTLSLLIGGGNYLRAEYKNTKVLLTPDPRFGSDALISADALSIWWEGRIKGVELELGTSVWRSDGASTWVFEDRGIDFLEDDGFKYYIVFEQSLGDFVLYRVKYRHSFSFSDSLIKQESNMIEMEVNLIW